MQLRQLAVESFIHFGRDIGLVPRDGEKKKDGRMENLALHPPARGCDRQSEKRKMALSSFCNSGPGEQAILLHPSSSDLAVESGDLDPHPHQGQPGLRFAELLLGLRGFQSNCTL